MSDNRTDLPSPNAPNFQQRLRETVQTYLGRQGNPLDRGLTVRDLLETGIVSLKSGFSLKPGQSGTLPLNPGSAIAAVIKELDLTPPPTPTGLTATAAISHVFIEHDAPRYTQGHGHLRTHVYGRIISAGDPLPTFADATEIAQFSGTTYAHPSNPATTWRLWIKWETVDGVLSPNPAGGTNGVEATTGQDVQLLLDALAGEITESQLYQNLGERIDLIDGEAPGSVNSRIQCEVLARTQALALEADARTSASSILGAALDATGLSVGQVAANIAYESSSRIEGDASVAEATTALTAVSGANVAALTVEQEVRASATEAISSQATSLAAVTGTATAGLFSEQMVRAEQNAAQASNISGLAVSTAGNSAGILLEQQARVDAISAAASLMTSLGAAVGANAAAITQAQSVQADDKSSVASQITTLASSVGASTAALQIEADTRASETGDLFAQYTVKVDTAGRVSGIGLASTAAASGTNSSEFAIRADRFYIAPPADFAQETTPTGTAGKIWYKPSTKKTYRYDGAAWVAFDPIIPFTVQATPVTVGGVTVPAGVYINGAYIEGGTLDGASIKGGTITGSKLINVSADKITGAALAETSWIESYGYAAGTSGWRIDGNGNAEFANATMRGTVAAGTTILGATATGYGSGTGFYAGLDGATYKWRVGNPSGARIQWDGSSISARNEDATRLLDLGAIGSSSVLKIGSVLDIKANGDATFGGKLTANAVDAVKTINIGKDQVTFTVGYYKTNTLNLGGQKTAANKQILDGSINCTGAPVNISVSFFARPYGDIDGLKNTDHEWSADIERVINGVSIKVFTGWLGYARVRKTNTYGWGLGSCSFNFRDAPKVNGIPYVGKITYKIRVYTSKGLNGLHIYHRSLILSELKK